MDGEEYRSQVLKNIIYTVDLAECSVRQLILPDMPPHEKLFYYQKAAALLETVLDGKYAAFMIRRFFPTMPRSQRYTFNSDKRTERKNTSTGLLRRWKSI